MVYLKQNQLSRYHVVQAPFLSTHAHFYDGPDQREAPDADRRQGTHKRSTFAALYANSPFHTQQRMLETKKQTSNSNTLQLFPEPSHHTRTQPSPVSTYRGNGNFTVEYPHSNLTYKSLRLVPYAQLSWKTEYTGNFTKKPSGSPYKGYSILSKRH